MSKIFEDLYVTSDRGAFIYILQNRRKCLLIDSGYGTTPDTCIYPLLHERGCQISQVVLTHGHGDHYEGCRIIKESSGARISIHREDAPLIRYTGDYVLMKRLSEEYPGLFQPPASPKPCPKADTLLEEGDTISIGNFQLEVLHTPGHSGGSISLFDPVRKILFSGDTAGGDMVHFYGTPDVLEKSLKRLRELPADHLLLSHAYPPVKKTLLHGPEIGEYLDYCLRRLEEVAEKTRQLYSDNQSETRPENLVTELRHTTLIAAIRLLEEAKSQS